LNLDIYSFNDFLKNERSSWRIKNNNVERFFDRIYMANQIYTFNNSRNFTKEELFLIKKASPIITHQLAIPKEEFLRLNHKFLKTSISKIDLPNLIIYNKNDYIFKKSNANKVHFSEIILENSNFKIYKKH
jgi:esterase/lipase